MSIQVIKSGVLTTMQDLGRFGYSHLGVSASGAMDEYAYLWGNKLLGNDLNAPALEILYGNFTFQVTKETTITITGAMCGFKINNTPQKIWQTLDLKAGDVVEIGSATQGVRVYLAVKNGFKVPKELGSASVSIKEGFGKRVEDGDAISFGSSIKTVHKRVRKDLIPDYSKPLTLRVLPSYQYDSFSKEEQEKFFSSTYTITNDFNRMACKLEGEKIEHSIEGIISEGISFGSVQIPKEGQPIILLKERQTIGGYPKIGSVVPIDCFLLSQKCTGDKVKFTKTEIAFSQQLQKNYRRLFP